MTAFIRGILFALMTILLKGPFYNDEVWNLDAFAMIILLHLIYACDLIQYKQN